MDSYGLVIGHAAKYSSHDIFQPEAIVSSNYNEYDNDEFNYRKPQNVKIAIYFSYLFYLPYFPIILFYSFF
jgi:hypothetical protein